MDKQDVQEIEQLLKEINLIMKRLEREHVRRYPITEQQFFVLRLLSEYGDMTIGELSQKCCLACSTMTDLIDRMEKIQVVKRVRGEHDRRIVYVHLLARGNEIMNKVMDERRQWLADVLSHLSIEERMMIKKYLAIVYEKMKEFM